MEQKTLQTNFSAQMLTGEEAFALCRKFYEQGAADKEAKIRSRIEKKESEEYITKVEAMRLLHKSENCLWRWDKKEYHQVKESPDALEKLHRLLWTKHKKEFEEKKALATYLFNVNAEVKALYFRYFAIVKEQNAELSEQYGQVKEMYDEAKGLYEKYKKLF